MTTPQPPDRMDVREEEADDTDHVPSRAPSHQLRDLRSRSSRSIDPEQSRPAEPAESTPPEANAPPPSEELTHSRLLAHYSGLVLASMVGCLIRLGLDGLATYDGAVIFPLAWSQGVGCGIMGLALARKNEIVRIYPPLYTFITTGIAGSITTFSSWMLEGYLSFSNFDKYNRKGLHDTVDGLAYSFSTFLIALAGISLGTHISTVLPSLPTPSSHSPAQNHPQTQTQTRNPHLPSTNNSSASPSPPSSSLKVPSHPRHLHIHRPKGSTPFLDMLTILSAVLSYLIALLLYFLAPHTWRHPAIFPILLSPPGAILRFLLARLNAVSPFIDRFPLGTFIANMVATLIISATFALQRLPPVSLSYQSSILSGVGAAVSSQTVRCNALYALQQGFCGCLSTVSTFAVESRSIKSNRSKWVYVLGSVILGHLLVLAVVGGLGWQRGYGDVCVG